MTPDQAWHEQQEHYFNMNTLDSIGIKNATDKASVFTRTYAKPHDYLRHLEQFFEPMRDKPIKLVECGVGGGESIKTWLEYFPHAHIFGVDIVSGTNPFNSPIIPHPHPDPVNDRYTFVQGDQSNPSFWATFIAQYGGDWDVVIDDGSHVASDMKTTFTGLWPYLKSGSLYEIEDLNFDGNSKVWLESLLSYLHEGTFDIDSIYFARELAVLRKK
jgi:hypothetical protein